MNCSTQKRLNLKAAFVLHAYTGRDLKGLLLLQLSVYTPTSDQYLEMQQVDMDKMSPVLDEWGKPWIMNLHDLSTVRG